MKCANGVFGLCSLKSVVWLRVSTHWCEVRGSALGSGTALQARRSRVRFPMVSLAFFIDIILPGPGVDSASNKDEYQEYFLRLRRPVRGADNLTTFMCRLSLNLGALNSWNPQGLSRSVMGLLYLHLLHIGVAQHRVQDSIKVSKFLASWATVSC
jgi:hypothetical protein